MSHRWLSDRGQKTEGRGQGTDDRIQRADGRRDEAGKLGGRKAWTIRDKKLRKTEDQKIRKMK